MRNALIVVDVQNDFLPGGALGVPGGDQVIEPLNGWLELASREDWLIVATRDWHPTDSRHFLPHGPWPLHCVAGSEGAQLASGLNGRLIAYTMNKGTGLGDDGYSGFEARTDEGLDLDALLERFAVDELFVGGLATDYCVRATVLDALKRRPRVHLLLDAIRAVNVRPGDGDRALVEMVEAGAAVTSRSLYAQTRQTSSPR
ncbi:MAG: isochorismatase family protein [Chloroflexota bacterium]